jgi:hypothetical protein
MRTAIFFVRYQMVPTVTFGLFVVAEGAFLYGLYRAFIVP